MEAPSRAQPVMAEGDEDEWVLMDGYSQREQLWYTLPPGTRAQRSFVHENLTQILSTEVVVHICSFLAPKDLCKVALVDTQMRSLASDDLLYEFVPLS